VLCLVLTLLQACSNKSNIVTTVSTVLVMSESENDEPAKQDVDTHRRNKSEQLVREVFEPVRTRHLKRDRPLYGYNFSPPSTPNGNHTMLEQAQLQTDEAECVQKDDQTDDDVSSAFTPRCVMQRTFTEQKLLLHKSLEVTDSDWLVLASYLSPCRKPPLQPVDLSLTIPHTKPSKPLCRCIACAGVKAQPSSTPCLVCGALIPYSVCMKPTNAQSPLPTMCFKCRCAFQSDSF
jgi:hypothetical protein